MLVNLNACLWMLSLSSWSLPCLFLAFTCTKREYCLCIHLHKPQKLFHMSPPYLPICGIYLLFQVNLYVPNSKPSNEILFCMLEQLMYQLGLSVSSMLGGLFSRGVDSAPHSRENGWSQGCPVPCSNQNYWKQNTPRIVVSWGHPLFWTSHGLMIVGGGGV